jgi:hypothetical protein
MYTIASHTPMWEQMAAQHTAHKPSNGAHIASRVTGAEQMQTSPDVQNCSIVSAMTCGAIGQGMHLIDAAQTSPADV